MITPLGIVEVLHPIGVLYTFVEITHIWNWQSQALACPAIAAPSARRFNARTPPACQSGMELSARPAAVSDGTNTSGSLILTFEMRSSSQAYAGQAWPAMTLRVWSLLPGAVLEQMEQIRRPSGGRFDGS